MRVCAEETLLRKQDDKLHNHGALKKKSTILEERSVPRISKELSDNGLKRNGQKTDISQSKNMDSNKHVT